MRILNLERGKGKTTALINACYFTGRALLVAGEYRRKDIIKYYPLGKDIKIYTLSEVLRHGLRNERLEEVYVDEIDHILTLILNEKGVNPMGGSITARENVKEIRKLKVGDKVTNGRFLNGEVVHITDDEYMNVLEVKIIDGFKYFNQHYNLQIKDFKLVDEYDWISLVTL